MNEIKGLISTLIQCGILDDEEAKVRGIALKVQKEGYETLSDSQKNVLKPFLSRRCDGVSDPAEEHNDCNYFLSGSELANAIMLEGYYEAVLCSDCMELHEKFSTKSN